MFGVNQGEEQILITLGDGEMNLKHLVFAGAAIGVFATSAPEPVHATTWNIVDVISVSNDGGFGASSFHDATGNVMSGSSLGTISGSGNLGSFNDVTGALNATFDLTGSGGSTFSLMGTGLIFGSASGGFGDLFANSTLDANFAGTIAGLGQTTLGFIRGDVCCSGTNDPNSFNAGSNGTAILTLWGADGFVDAGTRNMSQYGSNRKIGMDIRIVLTAVPLPAALPLLAGGLGLLGFFGWRRKRTVAQVT